MDNIKEKIAKYQIENGVDVIGYASRNRFLDVDPQHNPFSIFPDGETVILLGKRICRGSLRGIEEGTNFQDYSMFGRGWLEDNILTVACYNLTRVLEDEGYEAVPIFPNPVEIRPQGVAVRPGAPAPNVHPDFAYAAVACGIGEISFNDIVFTEKFGSRIRLHMVITDAKIEESPILEKSICDECGKCADVCPLGAISKTEFEIIEICGKSMKVAKIDYDLCKKCPNGMLLNRLSSLGKPDRIAALCNRTCLKHLEENELITNVFKNDFRTSEAWGKDLSGKNVKINY